MLIPFNPDSAYNPYNVSTKFANFREQFIRNNGIVRYKWIFLFFNSMNQDLSRFASALFSRSKSEPIHSIHSMTTLIFAPEIFIFLDCLWIVNIWRFGITRVIRYCLFSLRLVVITDQYKWFSRRTRCNYRSFYLDEISQLFALERKSIQVLFRWMWAKGDGLVQLKLTKVMVLNHFSFPQLQSRKN